MKWNKVFQSTAFLWQHTAASLHKSDYKVKAGCLVYCFSAAQINSLGSVTLHKYCVSTLTGGDSHKLN